jgi:hypothetical protein
MNSTQFLDDKDSNFVCSVNNVRTFCIQIIIVIIGVFYRNHCYIMMMMTTSSNTIHVFIKNKYILWDQTKDKKKLFTFTNSFGVFFFFF